LRARPERLEHCRRLTDEELAGVPAHMRERIQCTGHTARYRLSVRANEALLRQRDIGGAGLLGDRPISLIEDLRVAPGRTRLQVRIVRLDSATADGALSPDSSDSPRERRMAETRERARRESLPPVVGLDTVIAIHPGQVVLLTYDPDGRRLVVPWAASRQ
jgi:hypothetical protein